MSALDVLIWFLVIAVGVWVLLIVLIVVGALVAAWQAADDKRRYQASYGRHPSNGKR